MSQFHNDFDLKKYLSEGRIHKTRKAGANREARKSINENLGRRHLGGIQTIKPIGSLDRGIWEANRVLKSVRENEGSDIQKYLKIIKTYNQKTADFVRRALDLVVKGGDKGKTIAQFAAKALGITTEEFMEMAPRIKAALDTGEESLSIKEATGAELFELALRFGLTALGWYIGRLIGNGALALSAYYTDKAFADLKKLDGIRKDVIEKFTSIDQELGLAKDARAWQDRSGKDQTSRIMENRRRARRRRRLIEEKDSSSSDGRKYAFVHTGGDEYDWWKNVSLVSATEAEELGYGEKSEYDFDDDTAPYFHEIPNKPVVVIEWDDNDVDIHHYESEEELLERGEDDFSWYDGEVTTFDSIDNLKNYIEASKVDGDSETAKVLIVDDEIVAASKESFKQSGESVTESRRGRRAFREEYSPDEYGPNPYYGDEPPSEGSLTSGMIVQWNGETVKTYRNPHTKTFFDFKDGRGPETGDEIPHGYEEVVLLSPGTIGKTVGGSSDFQVVEWRSQYQSDITQQDVDDGLVTILMTDMERRQELSESRRRLNRKRSRTYRKFR